MLISILTEKMKSSSREEKALPQISQGEPEFRSRPHGWVGSQSLLVAKSLQCQSFLPHSVTMSKTWPVLPRSFQMRRVGAEAISLGMSLGRMLWSRREGNASLFSMRGPDSLAYVPRRQVTMTFQMHKLSPNFLSKLFFIILRPTE